MAEFMKDHIGEEFSGTVSGMTEWGVYVELDETHVEGMAFLRDIDENDYYRFDEARYEVYGHSTGNVFTLGDKVRVRVKSADLRRRMLDFTFTEVDGELIEEPTITFNDKVKRGRR
jgi:ribonuclease R